MKAKIVNALVLVIGGKQAIYQIKDSELDMIDIDVKELNIDSYGRADVVFDITRCKMEYILDMLLINKGKVDAVIRSLFHNQDAVFVNKEAIYKASATHMIEHNGCCHGVPCYACPLGYLAHETPCYSMGFADPHISIEQEDPIKKLHARKYLVNPTSIIK